VKNKFGIFIFQCFTQEQVKEINKEIKKNIFHKESQTDAAQNVSKIGNFFHIPCSPLTELLHPWLYHCQHTNKVEFGYDIYWDFHLDFLNYNVYGVKDEYGWHVDSISDNLLIDMKLTCLLNLSEETYEGGEFCSINSDEKILFNSGEGMVLNSLIAHKVTPVTKGERITLTYWATGPSWR
tara:strand:+ start:42 stop:584 length:543 start_codon:yes stop_codon:yes gene_type:complete